MGKNSKNRSRGRLFLTLLLFLVSAVGAQTPADPAQIVRRAIQFEQAQFENPAEYEFTEITETRRLDEDGRALDVRTRTREIRFPDYMRRRERYRKALEEIPEAFIFSLAGEQTVNRRICYVIEAHPKPGYRPRERYARLLTQVEGRLWIDKQTLRWVRLEAELLETFTFGWILLRIHKGGRVRLEQEPAGEEVWLPKELWYKVSARIGLVSLLRQEVLSRYGGYRKIDGEAARQSRPVADSPGSGLGPIHQAPQGREMLRQDN